MAWVRLEDGFDDDPDIDKMSMDAIALFVCSLTWSARSLTDGFIPKSRARKLFGGKPKAIEMLCQGEKPWWLKVEDGYQIRSYLKYNRSAEQVRKDREKASAAKSEAGKKGMRSRWHNNPDNKTDNTTPVLLSETDNKNITPYPVSQVPFPFSPTPNNKNSLEFQREPEAGKDYVLRCIGDEIEAKMVRPGTDELFDAALWFAERNLTPTRHWEGRI